MMAGHETHRHGRGLDDRVAHVRCREPILAALRMLLEKVLKALDRDTVAAVLFRCRERSRLRLRLRLRFRLRLRLLLRLWLRLRLRLWS